MTTAPLKIKKKKNGCGGGPDCWVKVTLILLCKFFFFFCCLCWFAFNTYSLHCNDRYFMIFITLFFLAITSCCIIPLIQGRKLYSANKCQKRTAVFQCGSTPAWAVFPARLSRNVFVFYSSTISIYFCEEQCACNVFNTLYVYFVYVYLEIDIIFRRYIKSIKICSGIISDPAVWHVNIVFQDPTIYVAPGLMWAWFLYFLDFMAVAP